MIEKIKEWLKQWTVINRKDYEKILVNFSDTDKKLNEFIILKNELETANWHLTKQVEKLEDNDKLNRQLLERYPSKSISWNARSFPFSNEKCKVPVQVLITPTDPYIIQDLKEWRLYKTGEDYETLIPKIYKKIKEKYYKYEFDRNVWGENEVWEMPFELREKGFLKGFDCDSWANFIVSYFRAAELPAGKVWVVAGQTNLGGHSTVYIWSDIDKKFHHMNSTYGNRFNRLAIKDFPTHKDAEEGRDRIGVHAVWVSYNDICARSEFNKKRIGDLIIRK